MSIKLTAATAASRNLAQVSLDPLFSAEDRVLTGETNSGLPIEAFGSFAERPQKLLCFLPSAQSRHAPPQVPYFPRWSWAGAFEEWDVLSFSDPLLHAAPALAASWFTSCDEDVIAALADFIREYCTRRDIGTADVLVYGSSMGGFGSLMVAAELGVAHAIAEVPQLDLLRWPDKSALGDVEKLALGGQTLPKLAEEFPERTSVLARLKSAGRVPPMTLVTNRADSAFAETLDFVEQVSQLAEQAESVGTVSLHQTPRNLGHAVQPVAYTMQLLKSLASIPVQVAKYYPAVEGQTQRMELPNWDLDHYELWGERKLSHAVSWVQLDHGADGVRDRVTVEFTADNPRDASTRGIVLCLAIEGGAPEELGRRGFAFSTYRNIGYFRYVALDSGASTHSIDLTVGPGAEIAGVGFASWDVPDPMVRDLRIIPTHSVQVG